MRVVRDIPAVRIFGLRALVRKVEIEKTRKGIYLPDGAKESGTANVCEVVALGDGLVHESGEDRRQLQFRLAVGDFVVLDPRFVLPVKLDGVEYGIVEEEHVLLVLGDPGTEVM